MILGFHTAGLLLHDEPTAVQELARIGFGAVALRPRRGGLDRNSDAESRLVRALADAISQTGVTAILDADACFLHDPYVAAPPSLVSELPSEAEAANESLRRWIALAPRLGIGLVTFGSGARPSGLSLSTEEQLLERLAEQVASISGAAKDANVRLALRPAHDQAIATVAQYERLQQWLGPGHALQLAADTGEMLSGGELPLGDRLARNAPQLACVYLCDRHGGASVDARIGHGQVALGRVMRSLERIGFEGPAIVRVEGYSRCGLQTAIEAFDHLRIE